MHIFWETLHTKACLGEVDTNVGLLNKAMSARLKSDWTEQRIVENNHNTNIDGAAIAELRARLTSISTRQIEPPANAISPSEVIDVEAVTIDTEPDDGKA